MTRLGAERGAVQDPIIAYSEEPQTEYITEDGQHILYELGWDYVDPEEALRLRGGETGLVFREVFMEQMQRLNPDFIGHNQAEELIRQLQLIPPTVEGSLVGWEYLKGLRTVFVPQEKQERNVCFIDTADVHRNTFHVTDEFVFCNGVRTIRADLVFFINGVPVLIIETKAAHVTQAMEKAFKQIQRYHNETPELFTLLQVYAITHLLQFRYAATWNRSERMLFDWKEEVVGDFEALVKSFLDRQRIIKLLTDFILFTRTDDELKKVILRPHQMRAVERVVHRAQDGSKKKGLVWHTQGSGKTYTMIVAAQKIIENPVFENPTVIMLVDRNELETQLFANLQSVGMGHARVAESKRHLQQLLRRDARGVIVSMIHKFDETPEKLNERENIIVLVDEAHRTTGGDLGNYLMGAIPNATFVGFTGTPIDKTSYGKSTFVTFGEEDPPQGYLDKYGIAESIADGTTVPLHYMHAPNELMVDEETLNREFLDLAEAEGISDPEQLNRILERTVTLRNMLKNRERMDKVARYVAQHYQDYVEPSGYKAFMVGVDREACALYKDALDRYLPPEYSNVVYSSGHNDDAELARFRLADDEEKQVRKDFRNPGDLPKILIVTQKLLTGFDAPVLYCMYLDKPMRDHVLLQAIARVNRPYEDNEGHRKKCGLIVDFVGIFRDLRKALAFDSADVEGVVQDIQVLRERFDKLMQQGREQYLIVASDLPEDKQVEAVLEQFRDEELREQFSEFFRGLADVYEILSPDGFLRPFLEDYSLLARMHRIVQEAYSPHIIIDHELAKKTAKLVQEKTESSEIKWMLDIYEINERTLHALQQSSASDTEKVINLIKSIEEEMKKKGGEEPYLLSIGERAQQIAEAYRQKQETTGEALGRLKGIVEEIEQARREFAEKDMTGQAFTVYWVLHQEEIPEAEPIAHEIHEVLQEFPHFGASEQHEREVKMRLLGLMNKAGIRPSSRLTSLTAQVMRALKG